jgi:hypothetical protein
MIQQAGSHIAKSRLAAMTGTGAQLRSPGWDNYSSISVFDLMFFHLVV